MLSVEDICIDYGSGPVLRNISFKLQPGSFTALLGPNGTGKSSLLKSISGFTPSTGSVKLGSDTPLKPSQRSAKIAYMPQDTGATSSLTVIEMILLGRIRSLGLRVAKSLQEDARALLNDFGLSKLETRTLDQISGGQRQLVYLAQTLFRNPQVLLLDEPTAALDLKHQLLVLERIRHHCDQHQTIVIAAMHDLSMAAMCSDHLLCLARGGLVAEGKAHDVLTSSFIKETYHVDAEVMQAPSGVLHITPVRAANKPARMALDHSAV